MNNNNNNYIVTTPLLQSSSSIINKNNIQFEEKRRKSETIINSIFKYIYKCKILIILFWFITTILLIIPAIKFLNATSLFVTPPKETLAYKANELVSQKFPNSAKVGDEVIVIKRLDGQSILTEFTETFSKNMYNWLITEDMTVSISGYYILPNNTQLSLIDQKSLEIIKEKFIVEK